MAPDGVHAFPMTNHERENHRLKAIIAHLLERTNGRAVIPMEVLLDRSPYMLTVQEDPATQNWLIESGRAPTEEAPQTNIDWDQFHRDLQAPAADRHPATVAYAEESEARTVADWEQVRQRAMNHPTHPHIDGSPNPYGGYYRHLPIPSPSPAEEERLRRELERPIFTEENTRNHPTEEDGTRALERINAYFEDMRGRIAQDEARRIDEAMMRDAFHPEHLRRAHAQEARHVERARIRDEAQAAIRQQREAAGIRQSPPGDPLALVREAENVIRRRQLERENAALLYGLYGDDDSDPFVRDFINPHFEEDDDED